MASWQARSINGAVRALLRRRNWGNENQLARRARRWFGTPKPFQRIHARGIVLTEVAEGTIRGEWLEPPKKEFRPIE